MNWWWNDHARVQFNYIHGHITQGMGATPDDMDLAPLPAGVGAGDYDIFGARFMVDF